MCRTIAKGGARCARPAPTPGSPWAGAERALTRAEQVADDARDEACREYTAALDALFTAVAEAAGPEGLARARGKWMDRVSAAWVRLVRALERVHQRRLAALDARWAATLADELAAVREARYAEERAALDHLRAAEVICAEVELQALTPDWEDPLWREIEFGALESLGSELQAERDHLTALERRAGRGAPDPRVISELRSTRARVRCWTITLDRQRNTFADLPRTREEADAAVARARSDVNTARAEVGGLTADERAYLVTPELPAAVEHSRAHPEQRRERSVRT